MNQYPNVKVVVQGSSVKTREALHLFAAGLGFRSIKDTAHVDSVRAALASNDADLVIMRLEGDGALACEMNRGMRAQEFGNNPFPVTVVIPEAPDEKMIQRISNAGFDAILLPGLDRSLMRKRISAFLTTRKAFIVTRDYVGPDRRQKPRPGEASANLIEVPNPVAMLSGDRYTRQEMLEVCRKAAVDLLWHQMQVYAEELVWLSNRIGAGYLHGARPSEGPKTEDSIREMIMAAGKTGRTAKQAGFGHVAPLCEGLFLIGQRMVEAAAKPNPKDLAMMPELTSGIAKALATSNAEDSQEIVNRLRQRQAPDRSA